MHESVGESAKQRQDDHHGDQPQHDGQTAAEKSSERWKDQAQQNECEQEMQDRPSRIIVGEIIGGEFSIQ